MEEITNKDVCIVIPIYKDNGLDNPLLYDEVESIYHTIKLMHKYDIYFLCNHNLNISFYKQFNIKFKYYEFYNVKDYNKMCLDYKFYEMFNNYKYMLICQPDAYIFKDELLYWCNKGYDYYGSLILCDDNYKFIHTDENINIYDYKNISFNGGFSLRNINTFYNVCLNNKELISKNKINEDVFICFYLKNKLNIITIEDSIKFGAEIQIKSVYPKYYNDYPFGCHTRKAKYKLLNIFK